MYSPPPPLHATCLVIKIFLIDLNLLNWINFLPMIEMIEMIEMIKMINIMNMMNMMKKMKKKITNDLIITLNFLQVSRRYKFHKENKNINKLYSLILLGLGAFFLINFSCSTTDSNVNEMMPTTMIHTTTHEGPTCPIGQIVQNEQCIDEMKTTTIINTTNKHEGLTCPTGTRYDSKNQICIAGYKFILDPGPGTGTVNYSGSTINITSLTTIDVGVGTPPLKIEDVPLSAPNSISDLSGDISRNFTLPNAIAIGWATTQINVWTLWTSSNAKGWYLENAPTLTSYTWASMDQTFYVVYRCKEGFISNDGRSCTACSNKIQVGNRCEVCPMSSNFIVPEINACVPIAKDSDSNGLIELYSIEQLYTVRYNLDGTSWKTSVDAIALSIGCPLNGCRGYELKVSLDFATTKWGMGKDVKDGGVWGGWKPLGLCSQWCLTVTPFTATFDGNGFVIKNLYMSKDANNFNSDERHGIGLFGSSIGYIKNLGLENVWINSYGSYIGGLVGNQRGGEISNCFVTGSVGGIYNPINTNFGNFVGGLVGGIGLEGNLGGTSIRNSYAKGVVNGTGFIGGLVGEITDGSSIKNSYAWSSVTAYSNLIPRVGGLVGRMYKINNVLENVYARAIVSNINNAFVSYVGGLVGSVEDNTNSNTIRNSYAVSDLSAHGQNKVLGGLTIATWNSNLFSNTYWSTSSTQLFSNILISDEFKLGNGSDSTSTPSSNRQPRGISIMDMQISCIGVMASLFNICGLNIKSGGVGDTGCFTFSNGKFPILNEIENGICNPLKPLPGQE